MKTVFAVESRLKTLVEAGERARQTAVVEFSDSVPELSPERRRAWAAFLCSIATTESIETQLLEPIQGYFGRSELALRFLEQQGEDERRHHSLLIHYVKQTFQHEKKHRSASDVLVYGTLLPLFTRFGRARPLCLLTALRFYEEFSLHFYKTLKTLARADGLSSLVSLIQSIEKDEARHLAGLEALVLEHHRREGLPGALELLVIRSVLNVLLFDINIAPTALHNRRVRRHALAIGIDPRKMGDDAKQAASEALRFASGRSKVTKAGRAVTTS